VHLQSTVKFIDIRSQYKGGAVLTEKPEVERVTLKL